MEDLKCYFNHISPLSEKTWDTVLPLFRRHVLDKHEYFVEAHEVARTIGFLESGVVRAYFTNDEGKEYNKQFFVGQSLIDEYSSLLTAKPNLCSQQEQKEIEIVQLDAAQRYLIFQNQFPTLEQQIIF